MDIFGQKDPTDSPCIGICSTSLGDEVCIGCGRTFDEVRCWNTFSNEQKCEINYRLLKGRQEANKKEQNLPELADNCA